MTLTSNFSLLLVQAFVKNDTALESIGTIGAVATIVSLTRLLYGCSQQSSHGASASFLSGEAALSPRFALPKTEKEMQEAQKILFLKKQQNTVYWVCLWELWGEHWTLEHKYVCSNTC